MQMHSQRLRFVITKLSWIYEYSSTRNSQQLQRRIYLSFFGAQGGPVIYFGCAISEYPKVGPLNVSALVAPNLASAPSAGFLWFSRAWSERVSELKVWILRFIGSFRSNLPRESKRGSMRKIFFKILIINMLGIRVKRRRSLIRF